MKIDIDPKLDKLFDSVMDADSVVPVECDRKILKYSKRNTPRHRVFRRFAAVASIAIVALLTILFIANNARRAGDGSFSTYEEVDSFNDELFCLATSLEEFESDNLSLEEE